MQSGFRCGPSRDQSIVDQQVLFSTAVLISPTLSVGLCSIDQDDANAFTCVYTAKLQGKEPAKGAGGKKDSNP